ncbi:MAG: ATP/GTP-binding protein [Euryarchaeota archaeon]|nr:ATP/GTP-binding protein [Euryarchaeota archaeon]MBU4339520.1 ATP/GTP-binding protein [Euryarchaeota archaeon]MCG2737550.1 ATP/GTP-binding protein [Candidatus Methanoperedenaceae archaeon]
MINLYFIGSAGSGKSTLTGAFLGWMQGQGFDAVTVNLDPGIENAPYVPDVDIRDWIKLKDIMEEHSVGPNGAQIIAADMLALNIREMKEIIESFETDYVIFDTPGQMELFTLRQSGKVLVDSFGADRSIIGYLYDPVISKIPSGFITLMLQAASVQVRFNVPFMGILTKSDLLKDEEREDILKWSHDFMELDSAIHDEIPNLRNQLSIEFLSALKSFDSGQKLLPVSSTYGAGMEDIYNTAQQIYCGGEDLSRD